MAVGAERPLSIAMLSYYLPSGSKIGVGFQVHALADELASRGHDVVVFSDCGPVEGARYDHRHIKMKGHLRTFRFAVHLRRQDFSHYDVVHGHGDDHLVLGAGIPPHVRTFHGSCFEEALHISTAKGRLRMALLGLTELTASVTADRSVMVSPGTRRWMPWVHEVIPNGVDLTRFRPDPELRTDRPVVLFVGTWGGRKRGRLVAEVFERHVLPVMPQAELWLVTRDAPVTTHRSVKVLGEVSSGDLETLYRRAWLFCLPSTYEGFGIPYVEAMASGLPVLSTPNVGARYVLDEGRAGVIVKEDILGPEMRRLLEDRPRREYLSSAGTARATDFSLSSVADRYEQLYRALLAERRR